VRVSVSVCRVAPLVKRLRLVASFCRCSYSPPPADPLLSAQSPSGKGLDSATLLGLVRGFGLEV
jgi:hypothetical protein